MTPWKPEVLLLVESPFADYDAERFGLRGESQAIGWTVADLTPLIKPAFWSVYGKRSVDDPRVHVISTPDELRELLAKRFYDAAIDEIGTSRSARAVRRMVIAKSLPRVRLRLGLLPGDLVIKRNLRERWIARRSQFGLSRLLLNVLLIIPRRIFSRVPPPDIALGSGSETQRDVPRNCRIIWAQSFDYEKASILDSASTPRGSSGAVFLDQNLGYHPDQAHSSLQSPIDVNHYYPLLRRAFDAVEKNGYEVNVALHPKSATTDVGALFGDRRSIQGSSQSLIRDAALILCHASASVSYAVIWRKPVLFLSTNELERSWYHGHIHEMARILKRPVLNIDDLDSLNPNEFRDMVHRPVDESAYAEYEERFIRSKFSPDGELWEIFAKGLTEFLAWRR